MLRYGKAHVSHKFVCVCVLYVCTVNKTYCNLLCVFWISMRECWIRSNAIHLHMNWDRNFSRDWINGLNVRQNHWFLIIWETIEFNRIAQKFTEFNWNFRGFTLHWIQSMCFRVAVWHINIGIDTTVIPRFHLAIQKFSVIYWKRPQK